jgi:DNA polymerase I
MWIFDSCARRDVELWTKDDRVRLHRTPSEPWFYLHLPDPHQHWEMIEALETHCRVDECTFTTIYGPCEGYRIHAGRAVAEQIERQTSFAARLYNVDIRRDQFVLARRGMTACSRADESRFCVRFDVPLSSLAIRVHDHPFRDHAITAVTVSGERTDRIAGDERAILVDLFSLIEAYDPDVVLFPHADRWTPHIARQAAAYGLTVPLSRTGRFRNLSEKSYWSYGRTEYRSGALIPDGRILIDTRHSFVYREGGLPGVFLASRLTGLPPNLTSRFTPGTLISSYEVYEAIRRDIAVPFRKRDTEALRTFQALKSRDRGGMIFQPKPGIAESVYQIDFTSMYPSIIVNRNLSPETLEFPERRGFLPEVIEPLLRLRLHTKQFKKYHPPCVGMDATLKWMLVTCFGYTGYRNAKFGRIEVHEHITGTSRELLLRAKEIAEAMGFEVLHGIVDCLWLRGDRICELSDTIECTTGIHTKTEWYSWIVFLPLADGEGAYNRYFGRLSDGSVKMRGIMARRGDTPPYVQSMQREMLEILARAERVRDLAPFKPEIEDVFHAYAGRLADADPAELAIRRRIGRSAYSKNCLEGAALAALRQHGVNPEPGMTIGYVVRDERRKIVDPDWDPKGYDPGYYSRLITRAKDEIMFACEQGGRAAALHATPGISRKLL